MNSESSTRSKPPSSQTGRKWLQKADILASAAANDVETVERPIVVSIPDVGMVHDLPFGSFQLMDTATASPTAIEEVLSEATDARLDQISQQVESQSKPVRSDLSEKPTEWTDPPDPKKSNRTGSGKPSRTTQNEAVEPLVDAILERFPLAEPTVLLIVGSEANSHIDETCARISSLLADRNIGRVLLVDSDVTGHGLTSSSGLAGEPGVSDVMNQNAPWKPLIHGRSETGLDFFPSGTGQFLHPESKARLRRSIAEMKREYQFICVSAGDAHSNSAKIWTDVCDGSYLLVSMKNSNETYAKSAVTELQASGARLLGCVVTDVA